MPASDHPNSPARRIDWEDVQRTRVAVVKAYNEAPRAMRAPILKDCLIIHLHSVTPPGDDMRHRVVVKPCAERHLPPSQIALASFAS